VVAAVHHQVSMGRPFHLAAQLALPVLYYCRVSLMVLMVLCLATWKEEQALLWNLADYLGLAVLH